MVILNKWNKIYNNSDVVEAWTVVIYSATLFSFLLQLMLFPHLLLLLLLLLLLMMMIKIMIIYVCMYD